MLRLALRRRNPAEALTAYQQAVQGLDRAAANLRVAMNRRLAYDCAETREHYDMCEELHYIAQYHVRRATGRLRRHTPPPAARLG